ncbi:MAG: LIC_13387 family protein [Vicinamibacterales bacterium]
MTAQFLLRVVAVVALLQFIGHGTMFVRARPTHGPDEIAVVEAMRSHAFTFAMAPRTYWDMYFGYGLEAAFVCLIEALLFWQLAAATQGNATLVRSIAALFAVANVAHCLMLVRYFAFPVPMVFDAIIAIGLTAVVVLA